jgi:hypothetical protein
VSGIQVGDEQILHGPTAKAVKKKGAKARIRIFKKRGNE